MSFENEVSCLKRTNLFRDLDDQELHLIASRLKQKTCATGTVVVNEGEPADAMFIVKEGEVQVRRREAGSGVDRFVTTLRNGDCFGEIGLLTGKPRNATVATLPTTELYVLEKRDLRELMEQNASISKEMSALSSRIATIAVRPETVSVSLQDLEIPPSLLTRIPRASLLEHRILPISLSPQVLVLAMVDTTDLLALDDVTRFVKGVTVTPVRMTENDFNVFMRQTYPLLTRGMNAGAKSYSVEMIEILDDGLDLSTGLDSIEERNESTGGVAELEREAAHAPVIRLSNSIIELAIRKSASDIHLEPTEDGVRIRYRIDGVLWEEKLLPKKVRLPLASRFKIMSHLDITERRLPQDGRISLRVGGKTVDFRVSTMPSKYGEKIVVRILDKEAQVFGLDKLITGPAALGLVREMIRRPYGIIYVTGPTGSGKTTTLYSALAELNSPKVNILTAEDPIEYDLPGITQVQVNHDIGLDFARVIRAFLRQDPDIILVGETRDKETAKTAVQAALTGHLVFTTLHTNDAPSTFVRLVEMGVEPLLISTSLVGIIAQRLVRRICTKCREPYTLDGTTSRFLGLEEGMILYRGGGCAACDQSGYKGRAGIYEVLKGNEEIRHLVAQGAGTEQIRDRAVTLGMKSLKEYASMLLVTGVTTVDEVLRTVAVET